MRNWRYLVPVLLALHCAWAAAGSLQLREGYVREMPSGQSTSAAYMKLFNGGSAPVAIVAALCDCAQTTAIEMLHRSGGALHLQRVRRLEIPAHGSVLLTPSSYRLTLINLKRTLRAGESVRITLLDEEGKAYSGQIPVVKMLGTVR